MKIRGVILEENMKTFKAIMQNGNLNTKEIMGHYELLANVPVIVKSTLSIHKYHIDKLKKLIPVSETYLNLPFNKRWSIITFMPNEVLWHVDYYIPVLDTYTKTTRHHNPHSIEDTCHHINTNIHKLTEDFGLYAIYADKYVCTSRVLDVMQAEYPD